MSLSGSKWWHVWWWGLRGWPRFLGWCQHRLSRSGSLWLVLEQDLSGWTSATIAHTHMVQGHVGVCARYDPPWLCFPHLAPVATLGPPKKFQHLTRAEEVVITRLRIGHTKATKSHILSQGPPTSCHHCGQTLTIDHILLECALLQECRDEYYTVDSLNALFETIPETCIVEFLREAGFFYLIWCNLLTSTSPQTCSTWPDLNNYLENESNSETHLLVQDG